ncbi:asparagine synthase (glutamine-hydrolyzing) [Candidatus Omnitrophota bacterium]
MCGIAGSCNFSGERVGRRVIERMIKTLLHRGPDDSGIYISAQEYPGAPGQAGLGQRRLSIIDLQTGHQPMSNEDQTIWIICNGEIYNFRQLRTGLLKKGHHFKSKSDTEVILHLYEDYGLDCVKELRGMFAFAIWDNRKQRLFLARDRVGQKPLVYHFNGKEFIFASEIKAILQNELKKEIDFDAIDYFLSFGYIPSPRSILKGIKKLPPAHILTFEPSGIKIKRYWQLTYQKKKIAFTEAKQRLKELLTESVRLRLISDVPLGAFLSGGMDSSSVVALISSLSSRPVKTFTIGFEEEDYSELKFAQKVAKRFNTEHREFIVRPNAFEILHKLVWHYNEPFGDSSCIPTYYIAKMTREFVPVALNGDGGDESLAGYERYRGVRIASYLRHLPKPLISLMHLSLKEDKGLFVKMTAILMDRFNIRATPRYVEGLLKGLLKYPDQWKRYISWMSYFQEEQKEYLYDQNFRTQLSNDRSRYILKLVEAQEPRDPVEQAMQLDINSYLPEDLLVKMDIATMANSLEARAPFLDHQFMEFAASLPINFKLKLLNTKYILKVLTQDLLPKEILQRQKWGFGVPLDKWFREELKGFAYETLLDKESIGRGYFRKEYIKTLLDQHSSGKCNHGPCIWSLINLEIWHRIFIDQTAPQEITV